MFGNKSLRSRIITTGLIMAGTVLLFGSFIAVHEVQRRKDALQQIELSPRDPTTQHQTSRGNEIFASRTLAGPCRPGNHPAARMPGIATYDDLVEPVISMKQGGASDSSHAATPG